MNMLLCAKFLMCAIFVTCFIVFIDSTVQSLRDGSKYAFIQTPYIDINRKQKEMTLEEEQSIQWPNAIVKYHIDSQSYDDVVNTNIRLAVDYIEKSSCVKFMEILVKPNDNTTWLHITNPKKERECSHDITPVDGREIMLVLGYDCMMRIGILHTLLHGIGMKDEVTHPHRDKYIRVMWDNIRPAYHHLYRKRMSETSVNQVEYDPMSVMHFHDRAFSRNGRAIILPLEPGFVVSPSETMSQLDQMKLQMYFGHECNKRKINSILDTCKMSLKDKKVNVAEQMIGDKEDNSGLVQVDSAEDDNATMNSEKINLDKHKSNDTKEKQIGYPNVEKDKENINKGEEVEGTYEEEADKNKHVDVIKEQDADLKLASVKKQLDNNAYKESENEISRSKNTDSGIDLD